MGNLRYDYVVIGMESRIFQLQKIQGDEIVVMHNETRSIKKKKKKQKKNTERKVKQGSCVSRVESNSVETFTRTKIDNGVGAQVGR